ncbi:MAG: serine protease [Planctomycetales bacterium]|nr:serine protease [Planctomycetales bacterium]
MPHQSALDLRTTHRSARLCLRLCVLVGATALLWGATDVSAQPPSFEVATAKANASLVTVRIALPIPDRPADQLGAAEQPLNRVVVCTGVAVGKSLIATSAYASADASIKVTTPLGQRVDGKLRVIDEYSGLMLVETPDLELPQLKPADKEPAAGSWVLGAAAWGAEPPVVSFGVLSGVNREKPGFPPMLQCDLRTVETSSGAAVLDIEGQLHGLVVAVERVRPQGLTYAVPVSHVQRLLRRWQDRVEELQQTDAKSDEVVVLRRRRPEAGMVLEGQFDDDGMPHVIVQRVREGGPAERAGIGEGDEVLSVDGVQIRSVYEAVRPVLSRQPGDELLFRVSNMTGKRDIKLVLGGGVVLPSPSLETMSDLIRPKLNIEGLPGGVRVRTNDGSRDLAATDNDAPEPAETSMQLLQRALERYQRVIAIQQQELQQLEEDRKRDKALLEKLSRQLEQLEQSRNSAAPASNDSAK